MCVDKPIRHECEREGWKFLYSHSPILWRSIEHKQELRHLHLNKCRDGTTHMGNTLISNYKWGGDVWNLPSSLPHSM